MASPATLWRHTQSLLRINGSVDIGPSKKLAATIGDNMAGQEWLRALPATLDNVCAKWSLRLGAPYVAEASCSWVAPCTCVDGSAAVLKIGFPHMEAAHEIDGLAFWAGKPTVRLLDADREANAMLIERCQPGTHLRTVPESDQDVVIAGLLKRLWRAPAPNSVFRPLLAMVEHWIQAARGKAERWADAGLAQEGLGAFRALANEPVDATVLATDLHAGNVLKARREPWLAIDPKPFVGDASYDLTQHLLNCRERLAQDPLGLVARVAGLADVEVERVRRWLFARLAMDTDNSAASQALARRLLV